MINTIVNGVSAYLTGNFYHEVKIYRDDELIDIVKVHCCEDSEEASYSAIWLSKKLTQTEKENFCY